MYFLFGAAGYAAVRRSGVGGAENERIRSALFGGGILWLIIWKMSLLWLDPSTVLTYPASLLYLDGGAAGRIWATAVAAAFIALRWRGSKRLAASGAAALALFAAVGTLTTQLALAALGRPEFHPVVAVAAAVAVGLWFALRFAWRRRGSLRQRLVEAAIWLGAAALLFGAAAEAIGDFDARQRDAVTGVGSAVGQAAPDVAMSLPDGSETSIADYRGKVVFLNFWATWCPPCRAEMPSLQTLHEAYEDRGVVVLAVNLTATERGAGAAEHFLKENGFDVPYTLDAEGEAQRAFRVRAYPTSYVIGADGKIAGKYEGAMHHRAMAEAIERELGKAGSQ